MCNKSVSAECIYSRQADEDIEDCQKCGDWLVDIVQYVLLILHPPTLHKLRFVCQSVRFRFLVPTEDPPSCLHETRDDFRGQMDGTMSTSPMTACEMTGCAL